MRSNLNLIVIDSNFILLPFQFNIDYLTEIRLLLQGEIKFILFKQIIDELEAKRRRESKATKFHRQFKSGLLYLEKKKTGFNIEYVEEVKDKLETTDDFILRKLITLKKEDKQVFLATNDSELRQKAKKLKISTIFLRQKKYLAIENA